MQSNRFLTLINVINDPNDKMIALIMTLKKIIVNIEEIMHRVILKKKKKLFDTITEGAACHLKLHRNCFSPFEKQRRNTHCHFTWFK